MPREEGVGLEKALIDTEYGWAKAPPYKLRALPQKGPENWCPARKVSKSVENIFVFNTF